MNTACAAVLVFCEFRPTSCHWSQFHTFHLVYREDYKMVESACGLGFGFGLVFWGLRSFLHHLSFLPFLQR